MPLAEHVERAEDRTLTGASERAAQPAVPTKPCAPINHDHLAKYTLGDVELEREILALFVEQLPRLIDQLEGAATEHDWYVAAHTLKGSARAVGAENLGDLAALAETGVTEMQVFDLQPLRSSAQVVIEYVAAAA